MEHVEGKVAFVTGAASGIGLAITTALTRADVRVMMSDINAAALEAAKARLLAAGATVDSIRIDVSLKEEIQSAAAAAIERFGKVHILANNAGIVSDSDYGSWTDSGWNWSIGVNLMSVVWGFEIFGPLLESHGEGGHIVSTASIAGMVSMGIPEYCVTKYGVVALSEGLREPMAQRGIGVSVLCPGPARTNISNSRKNAPARFSLADNTAPTDPAAVALREGWASSIANGIDPAIIGDLVVEGIRRDSPYIFTETDYEPLIEARFAEIAQGFDRIRDRMPRR